MFISVVPAIHSIRGQDRFTYETNLTTLSRGSIVHVPWRKQIVQGVVWEINVPHPKFLTKLITKSIEVTLPESYLQFIEWFSRYYHIALSHALKTTLPEAPKRFQANAPIIPRLSSSAITKRATTQTIIIRGETELANILEEYNKQAKSSCLVVIVPEENDLIMVGKYIHGRNLTARANTTTVWQTTIDLLTGVPGWYIGTKRLSVMPLNMVDTVIMFAPEDDAHKQWDLNPRYHVWSVLRQWQTLCPALQLITVSETPRLEQYVATTLDLRFGTNYTPPNITLLPLAGQIVPETYGLVSQRLLERCQENRTLYLWFNKKGQARLLFCRTCEQLWSDLQLSACPHCRSVDLKLVSHGTTSLTQALRALLPHRPVIELTKDTGASTLDLTNHPIIIGTSYAYRWLRWQDISETIVIAVDWLLARPDFRAHETVLAELRYLRNRTTHLTIQTHNPEHPVFKALHEFFPTTWYEQLKQERQQYHLPPFGDYITSRPANQRLAHWQQVTTLPASSAWIIDREH